MNMLGITGLGVDPAACLVQDGKLIAMAEEERFNRVKGSYGLFPEKATQFCLNYGKLTLDDINYIVFPWNVYRYRLYMPFFFFYTYLKRTPKIQGDGITTGLEEVLKYQPSRIRSLIVSMLRKTGIKGKIPPIEFIPHHVAHAASAFYCSGFDESYILVIDGSGEDKCTTIFKGEGLEIREKRCFKIPDSLGWFYQTITEFLGFLPNRDEGKVMALASDGKYNEEIYSGLRKVISFNEKGDYKFDASYSFLGRHNNGSIYSEKMVRLLGSPRHYQEAFRQVHMDVAFALQDILERIVVSIVKDISHEPDYNRKLCIAGGVGLNCKMNGAVAAQDCVDQIFIPPFSNDAGAALGAALYFAKEKGYNPKFKMEHPYWGPEFSNDGIKQLLNKFGIRFIEDPKIEITVAKLLSQDKIVGWFQNRMEIGPRALGARSILANASKYWIKDKINKIKNRKPWQPFAPSMLNEIKDEYLNNPKESFFMTLLFGVSEKAKEKIPAVIHVDNTTRPHFVKRETNLKYWRLIKEFERITGVPVIVNTSFNVCDEPIVCTPAQALRTFYGSSLEYLAIGNFLVYK